MTGMCDALPAGTPASSAPCRPPAPAAARVACPLAQSSLALRSQMQPLRRVEQAPVLPQLALLLSGPAMQAQLLARGPAA